MTKTLMVDNQLLIEDARWHDVIVAGLSLQDFVDRTIDQSIFWLSTHKNHSWPEVPLELSSLFTDDQSVQAINKQWRQIDQPTNVLSFPTKQLKPGECPLVLIGDLIFALETIESEAKQMDISFDAHLTHLLIHGFLHLLGYDHIEDEDVQVMESIETSILTSIGLSNPYQDET